MKNKKIKIKKKKKEKKDKKDKKEIKEKNEIKDKEVNNNENIIEEQVSNIRESYSIIKLDEPKKEQFTFSLIFDGDQKTGKTSIIEKFIGIDNFNNNESKNIGYQRYFKFIDINNTIIKLDIIDFTNGDFSKRAITNYKNANLIIFVYSLDNYDTFINIEEKLSYMNYKFQNIIFLVGNKDDLERKDFKIDLPSYIDKFNISFFKVSAKTGNNINKMFFEAVKILYENIKNDQKKSQVNLKLKDYKYWNEASKLYRKYK